MVVENERKGGENSVKKKKFRTFYGYFYHFFAGLTPVRSSSLFLVLNRHPLIYYLFNISLWIIELEMISIVIEMMIIRMT